MYIHVCICNYMYVYTYVDIKCFCAATAPESVRGELSKAALTPRSPPYFAGGKQPPSQPSVRPAIRPARPPPATLRPNPAGHPPPPALIKGVLQSGP